MKLQKLQKLQKLAISIVRFVKECWRKHKWCSAIKKRFIWRKKHPQWTNTAADEYTYRIHISSNGILEAGVLKNEIPYCIYYSSIGFKAFSLEAGDFIVPEKNQKIILDDLSSVISIYRFFSCTDAELASAKALDGLTIFHEVPTSRPKENLTRTMIMFYVGIFILLLYLILGILYF